VKKALKVAVAAALLVASVGAPVVLWHSGRVALRARQGAWEHGAKHQAALVQEATRLSNLVAQAKSRTELSEEQLRELLSLRNERRQLGEQTNLLANLDQENERLQALQPSGSPEQLSPTELQTALSAEMQEAMRAVLPLLRNAIQEYGLAHSNQPPGGFSDLKPYFPLVAGQKMAGLDTFSFVWEQHLREGEPLVLGTGDALMLFGELGRRPGDNSTVRVYGFSDGRVVEVTSEDGKFDVWENAHLNSPITGPDEKVYLEAEGTARDRARVVQLGASVGISAEEANLFFDRVRQEQGRFKLPPKRR